MISWAMVPALRLAIGLATGIALSRVAASWSTPAALVIAALAVAVLVYPQRLSRRARARGAAIIALSVSLGLILGSTSRPTVGEASGDGIRAYVAQTIGSPKPGERWTGVDAIVVRSFTDEGWESGETPVRLILANELVPDGVPEGSTLVSTSRLSPPRPPLNPYTFDYGEYLRDRGIGLQAFVDVGDGELIGPGIQSSLVARARGTIARRIDEAFPSQAEAGVAKALLIGDRSGIDEATRGLYTRTGAVHVLAVSGLHTGVIAGVLTWCLGLFGGRRLGGMKLLLLWAGLAGYVALTGHSPSVQRSAVMFGLLYAGTILRMDSTAFNSLGLSAIVLLVHDPQLLFSLGFQLSYAAVAGILAFYPSLRRWLSSERRLLNLAGEATAVSIAATIGTAPLIAYHFHQFPVYFILSGLTAVPLVMAALPAALAAVCLDTLCWFVGVDAGLLYLVPYGPIWLCNQVLAALGLLPGALVESLWPSAATTILAYVTIVLLGAAVLRTRRWLYLGAAGVAAMTGFSIAIHTILRLQGEGMIVYAVRGSAQVDVYESGRASRLATPWPQNADDRGSRALVKAEEARTAFRAANGLCAEEDYTYRDGARQVATSSHSVHTHDGKHLLVLPPSLHTFARGAPNMDYVFVTDTRNADPLDLVQAFPRAAILATEYIPDWRKELWDLPPGHLHVLPEAGAATLK